MKLSERDIYERVARQELPVDEAMELLAQLEREAAAPPEASPAPSTLADGGFEARVRQFLEARLRRILQLGAEIPVDRGFMNLGASSAWTFSNFASIWRRAISARAGWAYWSGRRELFVQS